MNPIRITQNGLSLVVAANEQDCARLVYFGREECLPPILPQANASNPILCVQGENGGARTYPSMGGKQNSSVPGMNFSYEGHREIQSSRGLKVEIDLLAGTLAATLHWQFFDHIPVLRTWANFTNMGSHPYCLEQAASFFSHGISRAGSKTWNEKSFIHVCANSWCGELRWQRRDIRDFGLDRAREMTSNRLKIGNRGSWSTKDYLPMGLYENTEAGETTFWQIEHHGSWSWEIGDGDDQLYLLLQGPNEADDHWFHRLQPGQSFQTVPAAVGIVPGGFDEAIGALTDYRRQIRRPHWDNERLPLIFNDYMHCLMADPTTEKELPYIQAAAELGVEIFVIDAGWYSKLGEAWWSTVGVWQPSPDRFDGGILGIIAAIREKNMIPGLWLELEVMGVGCPLVRDWPKECFFRRHGQPVILRDRYQLDFRHPVVINHANEVVDRLVNDYGVGFIKMDYNIDAGIGSEVDADSFGDGLLQHNRAYLRWLEQVFLRHPHLIIENCSSGGLRMDYSLLAQHSLHSLTDQEEADQLARIAAMGPSAASPEQTGVWVYPKEGDDREAVILNCINGITQRPYLSGKITALFPEGKALLQEAIGLYKSIRGHIPSGRPFWPLGAVKPGDEVAALGLRTDQGTSLSVWNFSGKEKNLVFPLSEVTSEFRTTVCYPKQDSPSVWMVTRESISIHLPAGPSARMIWFLNSSVLSPGESGGDI